jgi:TM2 domain-containing membrane protein YozV
MSELNRPLAEEAQRQSSPGMYTQQQMVISRKPKSKWTAYALLIFPGILWLPLHRFYLNRMGSAVAQIVLGILFWLTIWIFVGVIPGVILTIWILVDLFRIPGMVREANQEGNIVYNSTTVPTGSYAPPYDPTSYADTAKDASEGRAREEEEQQNQLTSPLRTPTGDYTRHDKLAAVNETIALSTKETLDEAQSFLTSLGYTDVRRVDNSLRAERPPPANGDGQRTFFLAVTAAPQAGGGVRVRVSGDDREGMLEHQTEWTAWSENLPKEPEAQTNNLAEQHTEETADDSQPPPPMVETFHFCPNCGRKAQAGQDFCPECGRELHA